MQRTCIAVDLMGGDLGPRSTLPACLEFALSHPEVALILVGNESLLTLPDFPPNIRFQHAPDVIGMADKPSQALRTKKDSSLWKVIELVASGECQACVSAGNTGAMMAIGRFVLKTFPGIDRPAICKYVPTQTGSCLALDLGANVDSTAEQLLQFALMGSVLARALGKSHEPKVCLLNNGSEDIKGNEKIRLAASMLRDNDALNYQGYIEGDQVFEGVADVVVCDGFVGNIALKISEGVARFLATGLKSELESSWWGRIVGLFAQPLLLKWHNKFDPAVYNGASFLGLQGTVVKSHGSADARSFRYALESSLEQVKHDVPQLINESLLEAYL
jgi:glycerol-3-phosphate acyltransferase PlsX